MFRQVAVVEGFCLLEYAALITDEGVFLVQIDGGEAGTLHHSVGGVQFAHDEFQQGCFSTAIFPFRLRRSPLLNWKVREEDQSSFTASGRVVSIGEAARLG